MITVDTGWTVKSYLSFKVGPWPDGEAKDDYIIQSKMELTNYLFLHFTTFPKVPSPKLSIISSEEVSENNTISLNYREIELW